jgi:tetratricopeptide (TPR) repeat protein
MAKNAPPKKPRNPQSAETQSVSAPIVGTGWKAFFRRPATISVILAAITFAVFSPALLADFVNYDDADYASANRHVQSGLSWENIRWAFTTGHASNWHPVTWLSHMLDCQLFGTGPKAMHGMNIGFHALNAVLLFVILRQMTGAHWRSAIVAGLFAWHPLHVESVAWISERKDVLSAFFLLLTLGAYTRYVGQTPNGITRTPSTNRSATEDGRCVHPPQCYGGRATRFTYYVVSLAFFCLGLMSKPMLVTMPFLLLLLDYWPLCRTPLNCDPSSAVSLINTPLQRGAGQPSLNKNRFSGFWLPLILEKVPFLVLAIVSSIITFVVQRKGGAVSTSLPLGGRLANAAVSYARYLGKVFWPADLSVLYPHPGYWPVWAVIGATVLLAAIFGLVIWQARRRPYVAVGWFWFFGSLVPVIGLVQVGIQSMADRYTYVPSIGLFLAVVWGVAEFAAARLRPDTTLILLPATAGGVLLACAVLTLHQVGFWKDSERLFRHAVEVTSKNYLAYNNLGYFLSNQGRSAEAMEYYAKSLAINPNYEDALNNVGFAYAGQKNFAKAIEYYQKALKIRPDQVEVHNNLGNALSETGNIDQAIQEYLFVLRHKPDHADAHNNLGIALAMQGKLDEAIAHFQAALRFKPNYASAHSNLGNAYAAQRKFDAATHEYIESLRLNPADAQAHNNLGNVLTELGRVDDAIPHYREALRLNSNNPEAHFNLGLALARRGQRPEAIAHFTEALRLKPDYTEARKQLESMTASDGPRPVGNQ